MKSSRRATLDDLARMPEDGSKYELVDGEILVSPGGMEHSRVGVRIARRLLEAAEPSGLGEVYGSDVGILLPNGNLRSPDVCFVLGEKLPGGKSPEGFGEVIPDLVVEVLSPGHRAGQVAQKIGEFLECGVPLVWLVDPAERTVTVYRSLGDTRRLKEDETITADPVLPGFSARVAAFFD